MSFATGYKAQSDAAQAFLKTAKRDHRVGGAKMDYGIFRKLYGSGARMRPLCVDISIAPAPKVGVVSTITAENLAPDAQAVTPAYSWFQVPPNTPVPGEALVTYTPTTAGEYVDGRCTPTAGGLAGTPLRSAAGFSGHIKTAPAIGDAFNNLAFDDPAFA